MMLGDKIHDYRISMGLTIQQFAEKLDIQPTVVDDWEMHKALPRVEELVKIEQVFGISVDALLNDKPIEVQPTQTAQPVQPVHHVPPVSPRPQPQYVPIYTQPVNPQAAQPVNPQVAQPQPQQQAAQPVNPQAAQPQPQQQTAQPQQQPIYGQPVYGQPVYGQPVYGQPVYGQPVYHPAAYGQPIQQPVYRQQQYGTTQPIYQVVERKEKSVPGGLKALSWITFGLSIASWIIAMIIDEILIQEFRVNTMFAYYFSLLLPQSSIIAFIILKIKGHKSIKNLVIGIVFTCFLLLIIIGILTSGEVSGPEDPGFSI